MTSEGRLVRPFFLAAFAAALDHHDLGYIAAERSVWGLERHASRWAIASALHAAATQPSHDSAGCNGLGFGALLAQELERLFEVLQLPDSGTHMPDMGIEDAVHAVATLRGSVCDEQ